MKRSLIAIFIVLFIAATVGNNSVAGQAIDNSAAERSRYIGMKYGPNIPAGHKEIGGFLLDAPGGVEYVITEVSRGKVRMLWLQRLTHRDANGMPYFVIRDVLVLPPMARNQRIVSTSCSVNSQPDIEIIAIADDEKKEVLTRIRKAWRANRRAEKFEEVQTTNIRCVNEGFNI